jgi:hypothetical protein
MLLKHGRALDWAELAGLDILEPLVRLGQKALGLERELVVADAMDFDYSRFDVVFSYRPFLDEDRQAALEAHLIASMQRGAYLLAPLALNRDRSQRMLAVEGHADLWKKIA